MGYQKACTQVGEFKSGWFKLIEIPTKTKNKDKAMVLANYGPEDTGW